MRDEPTYADLLESLGIRYAVGERLTLMSVHGKLLEAGFVFGALRGDTRAEGCCFRQYEWGNAVLVYLTETVARQNAVVLSEKSREEVLDAFEEFAQTGGPLAPSARVVESVWRHLDKERLAPSDDERLDDRIVEGLIETVSETISAGLRASLVGRIRKGIEHVLSTEPISWDPGGPKWGETAPTRVASVLVHNHPNGEFLTVGVKEHLITTNAFPLPEAAWPELGPLQDLLLGGTGTGAPRFVAWSEVKSEDRIKVSVSLAREWLDRLARKERGTA